MTTLLVKNASIIDGTGKPAYAGHLMADGDRIRDIFMPQEDLPEADTVVDAAGRVLCPGFINGRQVVSDGAIIENTRCGRVLRT